MGVLKVNVGTPSVPEWRKVGCVTDVLDDFNRADSSTLGTASSGLVYTETTTGPAVIANRAQSGDGTPNYLNIGTGVHHLTIAFTDVTDAAGIGSDPNIVFLYVKDDGTGAEGYSAKFYMANAGSNTMWVEIKRAGVSLGTFDTGLAWTVPRTFDCTLSFDPTTRNVGVRVEASGSSPWTTTISESDLGWGANTLAGFSVLSSTALTDNLRGGSLLPGRLKLWDGVQWVVEANAADLAGLTGVTLHPLKIIDPTDPLEDPDWLAYKAITPTTGTHTVTFDEPVTLEPGIDYWLIMQNCATNAQAQGTSDGALVITGLSVTPGMYYSFSGGTFGSSDNARYPIVTLEAVTGPDASIVRPSPDDYWGPSSIAQPFQVTATIEVAGLTAYWGGAAAAGKFGLARALTSPHWVTVACMKQSVADLPDGLYDSGLYDLAVYG